MIERNRHDPRYHLATDDGLCSADVIQLTMTRSVVVEERRGKRVAGNVADLQAHTPG